MYVLFYVTDGSLYYTYAIYFRGTFSPFNIYIVTYVEKKNMIYIINC